jgi:hypothetical protein
MNHEQHSVAYLYLYLYLYAFSTLGLLLVSPANNAGQAEASMMPNYFATKVNIGVLGYIRTCTVALHGQLVNEASCCLHCPPAPVTHSRHNDYGPSCRREAELTQTSDTEALP